MVEEAASGASVVTDGQHTLIRGRLGFDNAGAILGDLSQLIAAAPDITLDLAELEHSNSAGLALLVECLALAESQGHALRISNLPSGLAQLAEVCEIDALLESGAQPGQSTRT